MIKNEHKIQKHICLAKRNCIEFWQMMMVTAYTVQLLQLVRQFLLFSDYVMDFVVHLPTKISFVHALPFLRAKKILFLSLCKAKTRSYLSIEGLGGTSASRILFRCQDLLQLRINQPKLKRRKNGLYCQRSAMKCHDNYWLDRRSFFKATNNFT